MLGVFHNRKLNTVFVWGGWGSVHTVGNDMFITLGSVSHTARCKYIHINVAVRVEEH